MTFNYTSEKRKFDNAWAKLAKTYAEAGMTPEAIQEMYEYDWGVFKANRIEALHSQGITVPEVDYEDDEINALVRSVIEAQSTKLNIVDKKAQIEQARNRLKMIDRMVTKMYMDNAEGKISDDRLSRVVGDLEKEAGALEAKIAELDVEDPADEIQENYDRFFALAKQYTYIETLDRDALVTFIDRIEIGEKILPEGYVKMPRKNASYQQSIRIFYKFIGEIVTEPVREFAPGSQNPAGTSLSGEFNM